MAKIFLTSAAKREYKKLPKAVRLVLEEIVLGEFARNPFSPALDISKLKEPYQGYRLRVGQYRVLFLLKDGDAHIYAVRHRKDAYK